MVSIDPLTTASLLVLAASPVHGSSVCQMPEPTKINVIPSTKEIKYDYSSSLQNIQKVETDTKNPYGFHAFTVTQGFMKGQVKFSPKITLDFKTVPQQRSACLWYKEIDLRIEIDPTIVIGKEVAADTCMKKAVIEHELKHVKVDRAVVNKYSRRMGQKIYDRLKVAGFIVGPVPSKDAQKMAERMHEVVSSILKSEYVMMEQERAKAQQGIDSRKEYDAVAAQCPRFNPSKYVERPKGGSMNN